MRWVDARYESRTVFSNRNEYFTCLNALAKATKEFEKRPECNVLQSEVLPLQQNFSRLETGLDQRRKRFNDVDIEYSKAIFEMHAARDLQWATENRSQNPPGIFVQSSA